MSGRRPRIVLIGGTYRALCVLERLLERNERVAAFIGQENEGERDFCPEILEICDRSSIPARSARKLGEEIVRWLEDRIRPDLAIVVGVSSSIPLAIGGNCRLGVLEIIDCFTSESCPGVVLRQRGHELDRRVIERSDESDEESDRYMQMIVELLDALDGSLDRLIPYSATSETVVPFRADTPSDLDDLVARPDPGAETDTLEQEFSAYTGAEHGLALRSRREAFDLIWGALELRENDEVVCPGVVSSAVLDAIRSTGARPVFVDVQPGRLTLDPSQVQSVLTPRTRAMLIVHPFGQAAALDELYAIAEGAGLEVIEDGGPSLGARFGDSRIGRSPCACVFRLRLGQGPAGAVALAALPPALMERISPTVEGLRLGDGAAAAARRHLAQYDDEIAVRRRNAGELSSNLVRYDAFEVPPTPEDTLPTYASYVLRITRFSRTSADDLHKLLRDFGIETRRLSLPLRDRELSRLPLTDLTACSTLLLPVGSHLSEHQREHMLDALYSYAIG